MEFVSLESTVWQTDRWTGRLTDNSDANVAGDTPSETPLWLLSQPLVRDPLKRDSFNSLSSFPAVTETCRPGTGTDHLRKHTQHNKRRRDVSLPFTQFAFCDFHSLSLGIDARAWLSLSECVFKCFPVWEISVKWSCLSARLFLACVMVSPGGFVRGFRSEVVERRGSYETWLEYGLS